MADAVDSKFTEGNLVGVQVPPPAPLLFNQLLIAFTFFILMLLQTIDCFPRERIQRTSAKRLLRLKFKKRVDILFSVSEPSLSGIKNNNFFIFYNSASLLRPEISSLSEGRIRTIR